MKAFTLTLSFTLLFVFIINNGFTPKGNPFLASQKELSQQSLLNTKSALKLLSSAAKSQNLKEARKAFHQAKRVYKSAEYLLEHYHHSAIKANINGAPLPQLEQNVTDLQIFEPQGFQRLEELLYADEAEWNEIDRISAMMLQNIEPMLLFNPRIEVYDRTVLESIRFQLIRIATLGITGFENPAFTDSTLAEINTSFIGMESAAMHYAQLAGDEEKNQVKFLFEQGKKQLLSSDFDAFDRLNFIKKTSDPLFKIMFEIHRKLGIETYEETNQTAIATNYNATSLFDINLLNKTYFLKSDFKYNYQEKLELGKILFFDPALSSTNTLACASCHKPELAFTDGKAKSLANDLQSEVDRNAPTLINALFSGAYFHDLRADRLEKQTEHVMVSPKEFNVMPLDLAKKLKESSEYQDLFQKAYPGTTDVIKPHTIQSALAVYVASLVSWNSPFDQFIRGENSDLSTSAQRGFNLFMGKAACGTCHFAPNFSGQVPPFYDDSESEVLGILASPDSNNLVLDDDLGRFKNGKRSEQAEHFKHSIKTPTIRNIELTAPYFHNGAFNTLDEVMWFYNNGGGAGLGLDVPNQTLPADHLGLTQTELQDIIAFMKSLTDIENFQSIPKRLPDFDNNPKLQNRKPNIY